MVTADLLFGKVRSAWNYTVGQGATIPPAVKAYIVALENDYCDASDKGVCVTYKLPSSSWWNLEANAKASLAIARWCARAACALELLDKVMKGGGLPVEAPPKPDPSIDVPKVAAAIGWLPYVAGAALVVLLLARR